MAAEAVPGSVVYCQKVGALRGCGAKFEGHVCQRGGSAPHRRVGDPRDVDGLIACRKGDLRSPGAPVQHRVSR